MFGDNPVRKQHLREDGALYISSIFATIQGEGPFVGTPAIFVRLSGCNLQCSFCDTDFETVRELRTVEQIVAAVAYLVEGSLINLVVITGGEPFLQNITPLVYRLMPMGLQVQIETAGTVTLSDFPFSAVDVVVSPKTPKVHGDFVRYAQYWKYIVSPETIDSSRIGFSPLTMSGHNVALPVFGLKNIFLSPMDEEDEEKNKRNTDLCVEIAMRTGFRVSLQTHKIMGVD